MKNLTRITLIGLLAALSAFGQINTILQTSLSSAITGGQNVFNVASATGINSATVSVPGSALYVIDLGQTKGELMNVISVSSTTVTVKRPQRATAHASGAVVLVATAPNWFNSTDPQGSCVTASTYATPWVNTATGAQWLCSTKTLTWAASWGNVWGSPQILSGTATASAAGATAIAGPLLEISGTNAITSFTMSTGWNGQGFCVYPTGAFTGTASNNIAKAFTAVADRELCFTYNANSAKFSPSY